MSRFIETLQFKNGSLQNLKCHNRRFNHCRKDNYGIEEAVDLRKLIDASSLLNNITYKITISYSETINDVSIIEYHKKTINTLKIVEASPDFDYSYKYSNRREINQLLLKKESCDDIIILKNKLITDISFANIVFYDGNKYFTPASPLLKGTKREELLEKQMISIEEIYVKDLQLFKYCHIINAMLELEDYRIEIGKIV